MFEHQQTTDIDELRNQEASITLPEHNGMDLQPSAKSTKRKTGRHKATDLDRRGSNAGFSRRKLAGNESQIVRRWNG
jgi:hypothetical protein